MGELTSTQLLDRFADGIKQARAASKLLAMAQQSQDWLAIEQILERVAQRAGEQAARSKLHIVKRPA